MFDVFRLRGHVIAFAGLILAAWLWSLLTTPLTKDSSSLVKTDSVMDVSAYQEYGSRLAGAIRETDRVSKVSDGRLGILLGSSTLEYGVDPTVLSAGSKDSTRWLALFGHGLNMVDLKNLSRLLFVSKLKPNVLVLALTPGMFAKRKVAAKPIDFRMVARALLAREFAFVRINLEATMLLPLNRMFANRTWINQRMRNFANDIRIELFNDLGIGVEFLFPPLPDPWVVDIHVEKTLPPNDPFLQTGIAHLENHGWFKAQSYHPESDLCQAYVEIVKIARAMGATVFVVILPEREILRDRIPAESLRCFYQPLEREFGKDAPEILDYHSFLADRYFYDHMHENSNGRQLFSRTLSERLEKDLINSPTSANNAKRP